ncbi:PREDICTED: uncharacterized protein LOC102030459 [Chinchilla lanigera]|uniref:uncharacterized protein LOC102030459 n=1 Tax=Chinchilla lanigera TaxID=34839 RepID=UPI00038EC5F2|nr:PREDICTED: uncharacterized protein LOC102030459 [Chinchilla lanigera]
MLDLEPILGERRTSQLVRPPYSAEQSPSCPAAARTLAPQAPQARVCLRRAGGRPHTVAEALPLMCPQQGRDQPSLQPPAATTTQPNVCALLLAAVPRTPVLCTCRAQTSGERAESCSRAVFVFRGSPTSGLLSLPVTSSHPSYDPQDRMPPDLLKPLVPVSTAVKVRLALLTVVRPDHRLPKSSSVKGQGLEAWTLLLASSAAYFRSALGHGHKRF